jgi:hypothetical protein
VFTCASAQRAGRSVPAGKRSVRTIRPAGSDKTASTSNRTGIGDAGVQTVLVLITVGIGLTSVGALHGYTSDTAARPSRLRSAQRQSLEDPKIPTPKQLGSPNAGAHPHPDTRAR